MSKKNFIFGVLCLVVFFWPQEVHAAKLFEVTDDSGQVWQDGQEINIFGEGSPALLHPNKSGSYTFQIKNVTAAPQDYWVHIEEENNEAIPIELRINEENAYIFGPTGFEFLPTGSFKKAEHLPARQTRTYRIDWQWDGQVDHERDTQLGEKALDADLVYTLKLKVISEAAGKPIPPATETPSETSAEQIGASSNFLAQTGISKTVAPPQATDKFLGFLPKTGEARHYWIIYTGVLFVLLSFLLKQQKGRKGS